MAAVAIGSHRSGSGTAPRWGLGLPESTDQSRSNRRENEACGGGRRWRAAVISRSPPIASLDQ